MLADSALMPAQAFGQQPAKQLPASLINPAYSLSLPVAWRIFWSVKRGEYDFIYGFKTISYMFFSFNNISIQEELGPPKA